MITYKKWFYIKYNMPKKFSTRQELIDFYSKPQRVKLYTKKWEGLKYLIRNKRQASIVNSYIKRVSPDVVLDVGIGNARLARHLKGVKKGIGVDTSESMLESARKELGENWGLVVGDAFDLPVPKKSIDLLVSTRLLRILDKENRVKALQSFNGTIKEGGFLVIDALNQKARFKTKDESTRNIKSYSSTKKELIKELEEKGFKVIKIKPVFNYYFVKRFFLGYEGQRFRKLVSFLINTSEKLGNINPLEWVILCQKPQTKQ